MGKRATLITVTAIALLLAGIALAVVRLYRTTPDTPGATAAPAGWSVLKAIPSDAVAVFTFDGSSKAAKVLADSTGILQGIIAPDNKAFMTCLQALGRQRLAVSLHNSGALVPLIAAELPQPDSTLLDLAAKAGMGNRE